MSEITKTIEGQTEILAGIYAAAYRNAFEAVTVWSAEHPGQSARNDWAMSNAASLAGRVTKYEGGFHHKGYLCEATVTRVAARDAEMLAANYAAKVEIKAAGMTEVAVSKMDAAGSFIVTGTKAGHAVEIRQSVVNKIAASGKWFLQFPALVYIDGRKSTERALKAL